MQGLDRYAAGSVTGAMIRYGDFGVVSPEMTAADRIFPRFQTHIAGVSQNDISSRLEASSRFQNFLRKSCLLIGMVEELCRMVN